MLQSTDSRKAKLEPAEWIGLVRNGKRRSRDGPVVKARLLRWQCRGFVRPKIRGNVFLGRQCHVKWLDA